MATTNIVAHRAWRPGNRAVFGIVLGVLGVIPLWLLDRAVPRHTAFVEGTVIMFQTHADDAAVWQTISVRLDHGAVVQANNPFGATTRVGSRVQVVESTGLLSGLKRYRLQQVFKESL